MTIVLPIGDRAFAVTTSSTIARRALRSLVRRSSAPPAGPMESIDLDARLEADADSGRVLTAMLRLAARATFPELLLVHAAAIGTPRGAVLFVGPSGVGKTTIAFVALRLGLDVLADDVACLRVRDRSVLPAPIRLRARAATKRLVSIRRPPTRDVPSYALHRVFLVGAPRQSTARVLGTEALVSELPTERRWEAACILGELLDAVPVERFDRLQLDDDEGARDARRRLAPLFFQLGVDGRRIRRVLGDEALACDAHAHRTA